MTGITAVDEKRKIFPFLAELTIKGPERTNCPFGESRKYIVKEGTELGEKFAPSLGIHATAKEIAYSESSILTKTYLMISLTSLE